MEFSCLQSNLNNVLAVVGRPISGKPSFPTAACVLIETDKGGLRLTGTSFTTSVSAATGAMVEGEGSVCLPYAQLAALVKAMPSDRVDVSVDDANCATLKCGRQTVVLPGLPAADFPHMGAGQDATVIETDVSADVLREAIALTAFGASTTEARPVLTGLHLHAGDGQFRAETADGFRLSIATYPTTEDEGFDLIVPAVSMAEVSRALASSSRDWVRFRAESKAEAATGILRVTVGEVDIVSTLILGQFPFTDSLVPDRYDTRVVFDRQTLLRHIEGLRVFNETARISVFRTDAAGKEFDGIMRVWAQDGDGDSAMGGRSAGRYEADIPVSVIDGDDRKIAFNEAYLRGCLRAMSQWDEVALELTEASGPGVFVPVEQSPERDYRHIVMPMFVAW